MFTQESADFNDTTTDFLGPNRTVILWLVVLGLGILFIPIYLVAGTIQEDVTQLESNVVPLQTALASTPAPLPQEENLSQRLSQRQTQTGQIEALLPALAERDANWPGVMAALNDFAPAELSLTGLTQNEKQLTIRGRAVDDGAVVAYARRLDESGHFNSVVVQSIVLVSTPFGSPTPLPPTPTATATTSASPTPIATATSSSSGGSGGSSTATATSSAPTATATAVLTDDYEPDDTRARPIFLGQAQTHNFYPDFDVDNVTFLAKAGRTYEILTTGLALGVDTFLTVTYADTTLANDDASAGTLSSRIRLQAPGQDVDVHVQITNRGPYGPDKRYQVVVQEIIPTVTPTVPVTTPTATATQPPTSTPTPTATPSPTPSPTPDLRDPYEPNDTTPSLIAVNQTQTHSFYPAGDVDKIGFLVKNGRHYQVVTTDLAVGVDTTMTVQLGSEQWQNDDYDTPGSGNFASAICFPAPANGTAVATLTNVNPQFAPDKSYTLSVQEVPFLTTDEEALTFGPAVAGGANPPPQPLAITGTEPLEWTAVTDTPWLQFDVITGTTPATLNVTANISGLAPGAYEGEFTLGWSAFCRQTIPVLLQVAPASSDLDAPLILVNQPRDLVAAKPAAQQDAVEFVIVVELKSP